MSVGLRRIALISINRTIAPGVTEYVQELLVAEIAYPDCRHGKSGLLAFHSEVAYVIYAEQAENGVSAIKDGRLT